jgi:glyoxylate/hydroxypyruvate reductase A
MSNAEMHVLLTGRIGADERDAWLRALREAAPTLTWWSDNDGDLPRELIAAAVVANPTPAVLAGMSNLRLVQSLWAGVEGLLADGTLPAQVPLARMDDPAMSASMAETALWAVLSLHRRFFDYAAQQAGADWRQFVQRRADDFSVLVLGLGRMGCMVAKRLAAQGYRVGAWRATHGDRPPPAGIAVQAGHAALATLVAASDIVVNLLPLTPATRGLLDAHFFAALPRGASLINLARGAHVVDEDLLAALDSGHLNRAVLDVFHTEPLPSEHPYWTHPRVTVLPHVAALTDHRSAARVVVANLHALRDGAPLSHLVDRARGY